MDLENFNGMLLPNVRNISGKTIGADLIPMEPYIPKDYDEWADHEPLDYLNIELSELENYLLKWLDEHKIDRSWLNVTTISQMSLLPKTKGSESFIQIYVDEPNLPIWQDIHMHHQEVCKLIKSMGLDNVEKITKKIKTS